MKKWMKLKIVLLLLTVIPLTMSAVPEQYSIKPFGRELKQQISKCEQRKEHNIMIKQFIIKILTSTHPDQDTCLKIGNLILNLEQANQLIVKSQLQLEDSSENNIVGRLQEAERDLKTANKLHIKVLNGLHSIIISIATRSAPPMIEA